MTTSPPPNSTNAPPEPEPGEPIDPERWAHVDPDHPRPWDGCIRRGLCCRHNPGWFAPGEAEGAARLLGLEMAEFVNRYLILDGLTTSVGRIEAFVPVKLGRDGEPVEPAGGRASSAYCLWQGPCVFYQDAGCRIYAQRPLECRLYDCTHLPEDNPTKLELALLWLGAWQERALGDTNPYLQPIEDLQRLRDLAARARERFASP